MLKHGPQKCLGQVPVIVLIICGTGVLLQQLLSVNTSVTNPVEVLALIAPTTVQAGERTSVYGGLIVHDYRDQVVFRVCAEQSPCIVERVLATMPGEYWDWFGAVPASADSGLYRAELLVRRPNRLAHLRTYALHQWEMRIE